MRFLAFGIAAALAATTATPARDLPPGSFRVAEVTCFKKGEEVSGLNKICYYDCVGSKVAITIGAAQLCPVTIKQ